MCSCYISYLYFTSNFFPCSVFWMIESTHFCNVMVTSWWGPNLKHGWFPNTICQQTSNKYYSEQKSEVTLLPRKKTYRCLAKTSWPFGTFGATSPLRGYTATMARLAWVRMVTLGLMVIGGGKGCKGQDAVEHVIFKSFFIFLCDVFQRKERQRNKPFTNKTNHWFHGSLPSWFCSGSI